MKKQLAKLGVATSSAFSMLAMVTRVAMAQGTAAAADANGSGPGNYVSTITTGRAYADDLGKVINFGLRVVMVIAFLLVLGFLVIGGIEWITSGGDKGKTEGARNKITSAIIGLIVLAATYAILTLFLRFLGFSSLEQSINNIRPINSTQLN